MIVYNKYIEELEKKGYTPFVAIVKWTPEPKSTVSPCLVSGRIWQGGGLEQKLPKKAFKGDPRRFLSSRWCLKLS